MMEVLGANGWLIGTPEQIADAIRARAEAGVGCVMLQHHDTGNDAVLELAARELIPAVA
jgi:alkanesulfonate monooxygenase SsuD/methylene tetrahydromethanopterin reductase-like flavin-dependent oxidoreductase (luciferase family)